MPLSAIARSLAGALLISASAFAEGLPPLPTVPVNVTNPKTSPVPTAAQGVTQVSGAVDVSGSSVAVSNQPTVNLAPGSTVAVSGSINVANQPTVNLAPGNSIGISGTPSLNLAGTATVGLAPGSSIAVSSLPAVQISGTPTVQVAGAQFDSSGNLKVTGTGGSGGAPTGRLITLLDTTGGTPITFQPGQIQAFGNTRPLFDTSDCRSLFSFSDSGGGTLDFRLIVVTETPSQIIGFTVPGTALGDGSSAAFVVPGTSMPAIGPNAGLKAINNTAGNVILYSLYL